MEETERIATPFETGPLLRPSGFLSDLPLEFRWEFTRRHPCYLLCWSGAHRYHAGELKGQEKRIGETMAGVLLGIGVGGDPPAPSASAADIGAHALGDALSCGAIAPVTFRAMAGNMMRSLSAETKVRLALLLAESAGCGDVENITHIDVTLRLLTAPESDLDAFSDRPIVGINIDASQRAIASAVGKLVREHKIKAGIPQRRRREDSLHDYLKIWDLREGWADGDYEIAREVSLTQIGRRLSLPLSTVFNRYCSAFFHVTGHRYDWVNWVRLFRGTKLATPDGVRSLRRRSGPGRRRGEGRPPVTESTLGAGADRAGGREGAAFLATNIAGESDADVYFLIEDIRELIRRGLDDQAILDEMQFTDAKAGRALVAYYRTRAADGLG